MESTERNWTLSFLWTNLGVAVVVVVLLLGIRSRARGNCCAF